jgi:hypothetical protein
VFSNEVYKARHNGVDNPNIAVLKELHEARVELRVYGQRLMGKKVNPSRLRPGVQARPLGDSDDGQSSVVRVRPGRLTSQQDHEALNV